MSRVGRYEIDSEIGRGSMGVVYLAHDPHVRRRVALKTFQLPNGLTEQQEREYKERFVREAQAAGALSHPGIVTIYDADTDPETGTPYITMEYVEGESLRQLLINRGRLPSEQAFTMIELLADALQLAHEAGVVHRDIKPANILVREKYGAVKIVDFGVARLASSELTGLGDVFGTPAYMSPEQFRGGPVDARSDLFSLATILYQMLCGVRPFPGDDLSSLAYSVVHTTPTPVSSVLPGLTPALDLFFEKALAKDPADRFPDGAAFKRAINEIRQGERPASLSAPKPTPKLLQAAPPAGPVRSARPERPVAHAPAGKRKGLSRLEGAVAVSMLLLAVLPAIWILWDGKDTNHTAQSSVSDPASNEANAEGAGAEGSNAASSNENSRADRGGRSPRSRLGSRAEPGMLGASANSRSKNDGRLTSANASRGPVAPVIADPKRTSRAPREPSQVAGGTRGPGKTAPGQPGASDVMRASSARGDQNTKPLAQPANSTHPDESQSDASSVHADLMRLESSASPIGTAGSATRSHVLIMTRSNVKDGMLTVLVDGKQVYSRRLSTQSGEEGSSTTKRKWFQRKQELFEARIEVPPGRHEIIARVAPDGESPYQDSAVVDVLPDSNTRLHLIAGRILGSTISLKVD